VAKLAEDADAGVTDDAPAEKTKADTKSAAKGKAGKQQVSSSSTTSTASTASSAAPAPSVPDVSPSASPPVYRYITALFTARDAALIAHAETALPLLRKHADADADAESPIEAHVATPAASPRAAGTPAALSSLPLGSLMLRTGFAVTAALNRPYLAHLCRAAPEAVLPHLTSFHDYDLDHVLQLCLSTDASPAGPNPALIPACGYLYERMGDSARALELLLRGVTLAVSALQQRVSAAAAGYVPRVRAALLADAASASGAASPAADPFFTVPLALDAVLSEADAQPLRAAAAACVQLCRRAADSEQLWKKLLEALAAVHLTIVRTRRNEQQQHLERFAALVPSAAPVVTAANPYGLPAPAPIPPFADNVLLYALLEAAVLRALQGALTAAGERQEVRSVLQLLLRLYEDDHLGSCRHVLQSLLETYAYEKNILSSTTALLRSDFARAYRSKLKVRARAFTPAAGSADAPLRRSGMVGIVRCSGCQLNLHHQTQGGSGPQLTAEHSRALEDVGVCPGNVCVFKCGHGYHYDCLTSNVCQLCLRTGDASSSSATSSASSPPSPTPEGATKATTAFVMDGAQKLSSARNALEHVRWSDIRDACSDGVF
jgi:hypothetical protein